MNRFMIYFICCLFVLCSRPLFADATYYEENYPTSNIPDAALPPLTREQSAEERTTHTYKHTYKHIYKHSYSYPYHHHSQKKTYVHTAKLPETITAPGEPVIIVNPHVHRWGAYSAEGKLVRTGIATAGASWCPDLGRACRTRTGTFRINSLGSASCVSKKFPLGRGGAKMPYCMYFNGGQGIHGSYEVANANMSHGCVRVTVDDAHWLRFNFANIDTKVIVQSY